jgi:uncharacterized protein YkwD
MASENVAYNRTPLSAVEALMNSSGHRVNLLGAGHTHIGIGVAWCDDFDRMVTTQKFGTSR